MRIVTFNLYFAKQHEEIKDILVNLFTPETIFCFQESSGSKYLMFEQYLKSELGCDCKIYATPCNTDYMQYQSVLIPPAFEVEEVENFKLYGIGTGPNKYLQRVLFNYKGKDFAIHNVHQFVTSTLQPEESLKQTFDKLVKKRINFFVGDFNMNVSKKKSFLRKKGIVELSHPIVQSYSLDIKEWLESTLHRTIKLLKNPFVLMRWKTDAVLVYSRNKFTYKTQNFTNPYSDHDIVITDISFRALEE